MHLKCQMREARGRSWAAFERCENHQPYIYNMGRHDDALLDLPVIPTGECARLVLALVV